MSSSTSTVCCVYLMCIRNSVQHLKMTIIIIPFLLILYLPSETLEAVTVTLMTALCANNCLFGMLGDTAVILVKTEFSTSESVKIGTIIMLLFSMV
jgi:hypothetical protein